MPVRRRHRAGHGSYWSRSDPYIRRLGLRARGDSFLQFAFVAYVWRSQRFCNDGSTVGGPPDFAAYHHVPLRTFSPHSVNENPIGREELGCVALAEVSALTAIPEIICVEALNGPRDESNHASFVIVVSDATCKRIKSNGQISPRGVS
jgi:hypothetical protein